jgi:hypothetical protein
LIKSQSLNMPVFALVVACSIGAGVLADRNWLHSQTLEGASCDFVRAAPLPAVRPVAPAARPACSGTAAPGAYAPSPARPTPGTELAATTCSGSILPTSTAAALPVLRHEPAAIVRPAPVEDGTAGGDRNLLVALAGALGLVGIGAAWRQSNRSAARRRARAAAALAPLAALADPLDPEQPVPGSETVPDFKSHDQEENHAFAPADPGRTVPNHAQRRQARAVRKARWRRFAYILLFGGSVAAVAASTSRGLWSDEPKPAVETGHHQRHGVLRQAPAPREHVERKTDWTAPRRIDGTPRAGAAVPGKTPRGAVPDGRGGASRGTVGDQDRTRPPIDPDRGERLGAHMFDGHGAGDPIVSDPRHPSVEDRLKGSGQGGSGSGGGAGGAQGATRGVLTPDSGTGGGTGGHSADSGSHDGNGNGNGGTGGHDSGHDGGTGGHDGGTGNHDGGHDGGDPNNWLGNDPGHGGGTPVPEPDTIGLLALGIVGLALSRSRRLRQRLKPARPAR